MSLPGSGNAHGTGQAGRGPFVSRRQDECTEPGDGTGPLPGGCVPHHRAPLQSPGAGSRGSQLVELRLGESAAPCLWLLLGRSWSIRTGVSEMWPPQPSGTFGLGVSAWPDTRHALPLLPWDQPVLLQFPRGLLPPRQRVAQGACTVPPCAPRPTGLTRSARLGDRSGSRRGRAAGFVGAVN